MDPRIREDDDSGEAAKLEVHSSTETQNTTTSPNRPPPDDPTIRVIHCAPQINYAARGMIPPHIARELGLDIYDRGRS
jgi:hypothetical protein